MGAIDPQNLSFKLLLQLKIELVWRFDRNFRKNENFTKNVYLFIFEIKFLSKKNELEKKLNYHFDVEFCQESIFGNTILPNIVSESN